MPDAEEFQPRIPFPASVDARKLLEGRLGGILGGSGPSLPVYVDVGSRKIESRIERDGIPIRVLEVNPDLLKDALVDRTVLRVRVVSQSIPPGTPVPVGTSVNLTMTRPGTLPGRIFPGIHRQLRDLDLADGYQRLIGRTQNFPLVKRILNHAADGRLTAEDTVAVRTIFEGAHLEFDEDNPESNLNTAVTTLAILTTFAE